MTGVQTCALPISCIAELEAENDQRVDVYQAARIIDAIYVKNNDNYELLIEDEE